MKNLFFVAAILLLASCSKSDIDIAKDYIGNEAVYDNIEERPMSHDTLIYMAVIVDGEKLQEYIDRVQIDAESILGVRESDQKVYDKYAEMATNVSNHKLNKNSGKHDYNVVVFKNGKDLVNVVPIKDHKVDKLMLDYLENGYYHTKEGL